jgi:peptidyl-prolyl cis-trans isomerase D
MFEDLKYNMKHNRKSVMKSVTAWGIFGAIILVFVFWGLTPHNDSVGQGGAAATVNDQTISLAKYSEAVERMRRDPRYEQLQGLGGDAGRQFMNQQAMSQLVELELLRQATDENRIWTSDAEVAQVIFDIPDFQENGRFSGERYRNLLAANRRNTADFESELRTQQAIRRVYQLFQAALKPIAMETEKQKALGKMKANLEFVQLPLETLVDPASVPAAEAKTFLAQAENETKVAEYYKTHKPEFSTPEQAKVRHILIRGEAGNAEAEKAALTKIEDIAKRAKKEDFAKLASALSEDPGSKAGGGLIDYFSRGKMVPEFEQVAFTAKLNEVSAPVKTQYGYHLILVLDRKAAQEKTLEDSREIIAQKMIAQERSNAAIASLEEALKAGNSGAVQKFATDHKLKWAETGTFSIESDNVPKIGPNDEVVRSAFQMTPEKPLFPSLVKQGSTAFVLRYKPAPLEKEPKEDSASMMAEMMAGRRSEDSIRQWMESLRKNAKITTNDQLIQAAR